MSREIKWKFMGNTAGLILFLVTWFVLRNLNLAEEALLAGYLAAYVPASLDIYAVVFQNIKKLKIFDEYCLILLAAVGAFLVGKYAEAVVVTLFFQTGKLLELAALERSKRSVAQFMDLKPEYATRKVRGKEFRIDPKLLKIGHVIVVEPGERIPVDAVVTSGSSTIDTKALTGESMPREVKTGDVLYSGSINLTGLLEARVSREYENSTAARIMELVEQANAKKSQNEYFVEKFTKYYTPVVLLMAFLIMIVPPMTFAPGELHKWVYRGLILLVTAIPSGLVLSVPLAFFGGLGSAARQGILIKGYNFLESLAAVDTFVFDKTGTLTQGIFSVSEIRPRRMEEEQMLKIMAYAEAHSNHPIAFSLREAYGKPVDKRKVKKVREYSGFGVRAVVDGQVVLVGNARFLNQNNVFCKKQEHPGTAVHLAVDGTYEGYILITDVLREDAAETMKALRKQQMLLVMLTGDHENTAELIGKQLKMDAVYANLLPEEKVEQLEEYMGSEKSEDRLAFVGDGLNDAPVLSRADIGIAMGGLGSDAAIEAADIVLMEDELYRIIYALRIAKATVRAVRQNVFFAIGMKVLLLALAFFGLITMQRAILADMAVLLINLLNSYWILEYSE